MKDEYLHKYIAMLLKADAIGGDDQPPLVFNGYASPRTFWSELVRIEAFIFRELAVILRYALQDRRVKELVRNRIGWIESVLGVRRIGGKHKYLHVEWNGKTVDAEELPSEALSLLNEFLRIQRDSFLSQRDWLNGSPVITISDYTLSVNETELCELLCVIYYSGILRFLGSEKKEDFICFFCRIWNLPVPKDYHAKMSHVMQRSNPVAFIEKIKYALLEHIDQKDKRQI